MNLSRLIAECGPVFVDQIIANMRGPLLEGESPELPEHLVERRELMLQVVDGLTDAVQTQEHARDQLGRAKFLTELATHLIHSQGEITDDQARQAVDTVSVMLDRALELGARK